MGSAVGRIAERAMGRARCGWGFCTIRRIATACRRRVASLLTQFPPRGVEESGEPRGARRGARWGGLWSGPWGAPGADGGFAPLEASLRRVAGVSRPYWCNSPLAAWKRAGNPVERGGERRGKESGKPRGARCRTRGKHGREVRSCPHGQRSGGAPTRTPAPNPAVSQVSHRSFDHPSGAPDPE